MSGAGLSRAAPPLSLRSFEVRFKAFMLIMVLFTLGNSADAFIILRAQERGLSVLAVLGMLVTFNLIYALVSGPAGAWSDRVGRRRLIAAGWLAWGWPWPAPAGRSGCYLACMVSIMV